VDDRSKASFDAAGEMVKQLLALGTAAIGGTIALFDDGNKAGIDLGGGRGVYIGLALLALSVVSGVFALGMLAGQLGSPQIREPKTYSKPVRRMTMAQMLLFGIAILTLVAAVLFPF